MIANPLSQNNVMSTLEESKLEGIGMNTIASNQLNGLVFEEKTTEQDGQKENSNVSTQRAMGGGKFSN